MALLSEINIKNFWFTVRTIHMHLICTPKPSLLTLHERVSVSINMQVCTLQDLQSINYTVPLKHLAVSVKVEVLSILSGSCRK